MTAVPISNIIQPAIIAARYSRNGMPAPVQAQNQLASGFNQAWRWRTRELSSIGGRLTAIMASAGAGPTEVARAYSWTSANALRARYSILLAKPSSAAIADPYVQVDLYDSSGSLIGSGAAHYGSATGAPNDTPDEWQEHTGTIEGLDGNAGAFCTCIVNANNNARLIDCTVWEESTDPDTVSGYQLGVTNTQPILDVQRSALATFTSEMIDHNGGTQVCLTDVPFPTSSVTQKNIFDQTSTTVTVNTPGITLDLRYKGRKSKTTVPLNVAVFGACSVGANGIFKVYDATGAVVLTLGPFSTTPGWLVGSFNATLVQQKYDFMLSTAASTTTILYVSIFEQAT